MSTHRDILIIGAGPSGLALANALSREGLSVTVLEKLPAAVLADPPPDGRDIALTHRSQAILQSLGIWERLPAAEIAEIRTARVLHGTSPHFLQFDANHSGKSALGFLAGNHLLRRAAYKAVKESPGPAVEIIDNTNVTGLHTAGSCSEVSLADRRSVSVGSRVPLQASMSEFTAALGVAQLSRLDQILERRKAVDTGE